MATSKDLKELVPFRATHPGFVIAEELDYMDIKRKDFAMAIGLHPTHLCELLKGKRPLGTDIALKIEQHTELKANVLMALQAKYDLDVKRISRHDAENRKASMELEALNSVINIPFLNRNHLLPRDTPSAVFSAFMQNYGSFLERAASLVIVGGQGYFKKSDKTQTDERNLKTWLMLALHNIAGHQCAALYEGGGAEKVAMEIAEIARKGCANVTAIAEILGKHGITYVHEPKLDKVPVDAFSTLFNGRPAIAATYRYNDMDKLVFDILHELGHIAMHLTEGNAFIKIGDEPSKETQEREADSFARNMLIDPKTWALIMNSGTKSLDYYNVVNKVAEAAAQYGIAPSMAVARYKKESGYYAIARFKSPRIHY